MTAPAAAIGRGVVEGFYGKAYSFEARLALVRWLGELGLDTYVVAPKANLARDARADALPLDEAQGLRELVEEGRRVGVRVGYALALDAVLPLPLGARGQPGSPTVTRALVARATELAQLGVDLVAVSADDTWTTFVPWAGSRRRGRAHADGAARVLGALRTAHGAEARVVVVPAVYQGRADELPRGALRYLEGLASLDVTLPVLWTGPRIFSRWIDAAGLAAWQRRVGLPVGVWSNAVANDWLPLATGEPLGRQPDQRLCFDAPAHLAPEVLASGAGVWLNGAREPRLFAVSLACLAEALAAPHDYRPADAHDRALRRVFGDAAAVVTEVHALVRRHPLVTPDLPDAPELSALVATYLSDGTGRDALSDALTRLASLEGRLARALAGHPALLELAPTAEAARLHAELGLAALGLASPAALDAARARARTTRWRVGLDPIAALARYARATVTRR